MPISRLTKASFLQIVLAAALLAGSSTAAETYSLDFSKLPLGSIPAGWRDDGIPHVNCNWAIDGKGFLRVVNKDELGLLILPAQFTDGTLTATFKKTPDDPVYFGLIARYQNQKNYYTARFSSDQRLFLIQVIDGKEKILGEWVSRRRYTENSLWKLSFSINNANMATVLLADENNDPQSRIDYLLQNPLPAGAIGISSTTYAAAQDLTLCTENPLNLPPAPATTGTSTNPLAPRVLAPVPYDQIDSLNTPFEKLSDNYDIIVAGAGTGGWAAAVQAARLSARVLLLEESDWIGGQMAAAAVATMDEEGCWEKFPVRERGLYREFHESIVNYYYTLNKDPFRAYYAWPEQLEGGYEPKAVRATLYASIKNTRNNNHTLDLATRTRITAVQKSGNTITGATITHDGAAKNIRCKIIIDATEYGDVLPLAGARYRVASTTSDKLSSPENPAAFNQARQLYSHLLSAPRGIVENLLKNADILEKDGKEAAALKNKLATELRKNNRPEAADALLSANKATFHALTNSILQYHTWLGVIREYPQGVPDHLQIKQAPPGYDSRQYKGSQLAGALIWGGAGRDVKGPRDYRVLFAWRGFADSDSPATGNLSQGRHTECGLNGGRQDYPVNIDSVENIDARKRAELEGINRTLCEIYYFQQELGLPWAVAVDEGFSTPYNRGRMATLGIREDLLPIAIHLPQHPYAREARRMAGVYTLRAGDLTRWEKAKLFPTSVAMGDYFMDLDHGPTAHALEKDLDQGEPPRGGGPFQIPFESFIPETIDGLVPAEKNISQSRLANGATRLQPITILNGQAAGTIAALAVQQKIQPRQLNPIQVQATLLRSGSNLIQRWYQDIEWCSPLWSATQLLALHSVLDAPGSFNKTRNQSPGANNFWNPAQKISAADYKSALTRLSTLCKIPTTDLAQKIPGSSTRAQFALAAAQLLETHGTPDWPPNQK